MRNFVILVLVEIFWMREEFWVVRGSRVPGTPRYSLLVPLPRREPPQVLLPR